MENIKEQEEMRAVVSSLTPGAILSPELDGHYIDTWVLDFALRERLSFRHASSWETEKRVRHLPHDALVAVSTASWVEQAVLRVREMLVRVVIHSSDNCTAQVYAPRYAAGDVEAVIAQLKGWLEPKEVRTADSVLVGFRYMGGSGPEHRTRSIDAPAWAAIRANYAASVQSRVDALASTFRPGTSGRLILFHGAPGTGKTYVIRALAREWREWCKFEYVADPEQFFGQASYMMASLLDAEDEEDENEGVQWRMLVIEDAGELLAQDARKHEGQGLSRLLNMSEGLIGQGLRVMTLITTNDPLEVLNEAVARPGRTAAEVEFTPLSAREASEWVARAGSGLAVDEEMTLAELYAFTRSGDRPQRRPRRALGFGRN